MIKCSYGSIMIPNHEAHTMAMDFKVVVRTMIFEILFLPSPDLQGGCSRRLRHQTSRPDEDQDDDDDDHYEDDDDYDADHKSFLWLL